MKRQILDSGSSTSFEFLVSGFKLKEITLTPPSPVEGEEDPGRKDKETTPHPRHVFA